MAANIATYARIRPFVREIEESKQLTALADVYQNKIIHEDAEQDFKKNTYQFTKVFNEQNTTEQVFENAMKP